MHSIRGLVVGVIVIATATGCSQSTVRPSAYGATTLTSAQVQMTPSEPLAPSRMKNVPPMSSERQLEIALRAEETRRERADTERVGDRNVALEREVAAMLSADAAQRDSDVRVSATPGGTVRISGVVRSVRARRNAEVLIARVPGVVAFEDALQVRPRDAADPAAALVPRVIAMLDWDPRLDGDRVHVEATEAGSVRLTGRLAEESQRAAAVDDAFAAGATLVVDRLDVVPGSRPMNPR